MNDGPILVLNSGSSSLKIAVFQQSGKEECLLLQGSADRLGRPDGKLLLEDAQGAPLLHQEHTLESQQQALPRLVSALKQHLPAEPVAIGHRVVHGGPHLREHQRITPNVLAQLQAAIHFAPLHIPDALRAIEQAQQIFPNTPQIACFDTAFHRTMPPIATRLPIPAEFADQGVQRYGFHGRSCESVVHRLGPQPPARVLIAHLGGGCSVTAVENGRSVDTTMGMSPTGGIPMSTRSGDLDPAVLLFMLRSGMDADALEQALNHNCGLFGISNGEADMQALQSKAATGDTAAQLAIEIFCTDIRKAIGAYAALLGGIDLLVFTGGIGEHSETIRANILAGLGHLRLGADNTGTARVVAMQAEEEITIARHCRALLQLSA